MSVIRFLSSTESHPFECQEAQPCSGADGREAPCRIELPRRPPHTSTLDVMKMGPITTFFAWLLGSIVLGALGAPHEHGTGLFVFVVVIWSGTIAGLIHALLVYRRNRRTSHAGELHDV
jgi:hypothetical protein